MLQQLCCIWCWYCNYNLPRSNLQLIVYLGKVGMPLASLMVWSPEPEGHTMYRFYVDQHMISCLTSTQRTSGAGFPCHHSSIQICSCLSMPQWAAMGLSVLPGWSGNVLRPLPSWWCIHHPQSHESNMWSHRPSVATQWWYATECWVIKHSGRYRYRRYSFGVWASVQKHKDCQRFNAWRSVLFLDGSLFNLPRFCELLCARALREIHGKLYNVVDLITTPWFLPPFQSLS